MDGPKLRPRIATWGDPHFLTFITAWVHCNRSGKGLSWQPAVRTISPGNHGHVSFHCKNPDIIVAWNYCDVINQVWIVIRLYSLCFQLEMCCLILLYPRRPMHFVFSQICVNCVATSLMNRLQKQCELFVSYNIALFVRKMLKASLYKMETQEEEHNGSQLEKHSSLLVNSTLS